MVRSTQAPALGSAMFGAVAAGRGKGGYDDIAEAAAEMGGVEEQHIYAHSGKRGGVSEAV